MAGITRAPRAEWSFAEHEHRDLVRGINHIHDVACEIGSRTRAEVSVHLLDVVRWFERDLEPHMGWEEAWLYPQIDARTGTPWATKAARFDHRQIAQAVERIRADHECLATSGDGRELVDARCHLFGLEALVRAHIEREERFLIPLLETVPAA